MAGFGVDAGVEVVEGVLLGRVEVRLVGGTSGRGGSRRGGNGALVVLRDSSVLGHDEATASCAAVLAVRDFVQAPAAIRTCDQWSFCAIV